MTQTPAADIVERLRTTRASWPLSEEAAIEIEALQRKIDEAGKALERTKDSLCRAYCSWSKYDDVPLEHYGDCKLASAAIASIRGETE